MAIEKENMHFYIYGLYDISDKKQKIRYVGKTINIEKRLQQHKLFHKQTKLRYNHRDYWVMSVLNKKSDINIIIIEICHKDNWAEREIYWIDKLKIKNKLTNTAKGGMGGKGKQYSISYTKAKVWIKENLSKIKSKNDWIKNIELLPDFMPKNPREVYLKSGWVSWGDFLGTGKKQDNLLAKNYITYHDAKKWIVEKFNHIDSIKHWKELVKNKKIPNTIPNRPDRFYKTKNRGWISWGDFLGTGRIANQKLIFLSYNEAKKFLKKEKIASQSKWRKYTKSENFNVLLPKDPRSHYIITNEWISFGDFVSTGKKQDNLLAKNYTTYQEAKKWIKENLPTINSMNEWKKNYVSKNKIPFFIPNTPHLFYNKKNRGWLGWNDFLSNGIIPNYKKQFFSYDESKKWIKENLPFFNNYEEWRKYVKNNELPTFIPKAPDVVYKNNGWVTYGDFLSNGNISNNKKKFYNYDECKEKITKYIISTSTEFIAKRKILEEKIPSDPVRFYKKEWRGWSDFLQR